MTESAHITALQRFSYIGQICHYTIHHRHRLNKNCKSSAVS